jgi:hypothetical protein
MGIAHAIALSQILVCLLLQVPAASASAEQVSNGVQSSPASSIQLTLSEQAPTTLYLEVGHAPLGQVLKEIVSKTGAKIHYSVLPDEPVTATCAGATVKQIMECLLGSRVDRIYRNLPETLTVKAKTGLLNNSIQPQEIWILGSRYGNASGTMHCVLDGSQVSKNKQNKAVHSEDNPNRALIRMAQITNDPRFAELRKQALSMLATQGRTGDAETDADITETLHKALTDEDAEMRAQAVFGLMQQDKADDSILLDALQDKNADVRLMAVDNANADNPQGRAVLNQALNDSDADVRAFAEHKLEPSTGTQ